MAGRTGLAGRDPWDGSTQITLLDGSKEMGARVHHLSATGDNRWWRLDVTIRDSTLTMIGQPTPTPIAIPSGQAEQSTAAWPDTLSQLTPSDALKALLTKFGQALAGNDPELLRTMIADPDSASVYTPLSLGDADVTAGTAAYLDRGDVNRNDQ